MSLLWFCVLLLVASVCGNPPEVINLGTRFIPRYHNQYSDLVARILRARGIRVYSVHDVGALTSTTLSRRFYGIGGDSSLGLDNTFVRSSVATGRPSITYEELYGGVDTSDLPDAAVPLVGSTSFPGPYGPETGGPGPYDLGPIGDGPGPYGPGPYGPGDGPGPYGLGPDGGSGPYGPELDGPGPYDTGLSGSGLSGFGTAGVEIGGSGLSTAGLGVDRLYDESYINGPRGTGFGDFGGLDDGFSTSSGSLLTGSSSIYPSTYYGPLSTGGRSSVFTSYQSTSPTYTDLYNRRFSSAELGAGAGAGIGLDGALGSGFSATSSFVDTTPYSGFSSAGAGYSDDYGLDGGLGYMRRYRRTYTLPGYSSVQRRIRYLPRRQFTTRVVNFPPTVTTYQ